MESEDVVKRADIRGWTADLVPLPVGPVVSRNRRNIAVVLIAEQLLALARNLVSLVRVVFHVLLVDSCDAVFDTILVPPEIISFSKGGKN